MVQCDPGSSSRMVDTDCGCHLMVDDATLQTQYGTSIKMKFSVLAATDVAQVGKSLTEFFECEGKAVDKLYNLAGAMGLITASQRKIAAEQGVGIEIDETLFKGRQLCAQVKMETNKRKNPATGTYEENPENPGPFPRIGFRSFGVGEKKAESIPKDKQFLKLSGKPPLPSSPDQQTQPPSDENPMTW